MTRACAPLAAAALSFMVPGAGQLACGARAKGIALLCMSGGLAIGMWVAAAGPARMQSLVTVMLLSLMAPCIWIPAAIDAYQEAAGRAKPLLTNAKPWYLIVMLLTIGPLALPMLWQGSMFSRAAKIGWTIAVIALALLGIVLAVVIGPLLQAWLSRTQQMLAPY